MIHAYNEFYLNDAKKTLAAMFDYAVNDCRFNIDKFATFFVKTGYAKQFETGNPGVISGMSGVELANKIIYKVFHEDNSVDSIQPVYKTIEYWAGWVLADYQWYSAYRFKDIFDKIKMSEIVDMYELYHEMDITRFYEKMNSIMNCNAAVTRLKTIREAAEKTILIRRKDRSSINLLLHSVAVLRICWKCQWLKNNTTIENGCPRGPFVNL